MQHMVQLILRHVLFSEWMVVPPKSGRSVAIGVISHV